MSAADRSPEVSVGDVAGAATYLKGLSNSNGKVGTSVKIS